MAPKPDAPCLPDLRPRAGGLTSLRFLTCGMGMTTVTPVWRGAEGITCGNPWAAFRRGGPWSRAAVRRSRWVRRLLTWPPGRLTCGRISPISVFGPREWFEVVRFPGPGILSRESPPDRWCTPGLGGCVRPLCWVADGRRGSRERSPAVDA